MPQTVEQFNDAARSLASLTSQDLRDMTVGALKRKLREVRITHVQRGDKQVSVDSARKAELIKAIDDFCVRQRVIDTSAPELVEINAEDLRNDLLVSLLHHNEALKVFAGRLYDKLRSYTIEQWDAEKQQWKPDGSTPTHLAMELALWLDAYRTEEGEPLQDNTKIRYRSTVIGLLKEAMANDATQFFYEQLNNHYWEQFRKFLFSQTRHRTVKRNEQHKQNLVERREHTQVINTTDAILFAKDTLENLTDSSKWYLVSIALVVASGRRMSELHCTAKFEPFNADTNTVPETLTGVPVDHLLWFSGQLKKRDDDDKPYVIPTLVPASLVVAGHEWLRRKGKVLISTERVNKELSANMSKRYIQPWYDAYLPNVANYDRMVKDEFGNPKTQEVKVRTYHRLRDIYGKCALTSFYTGSPYAYGAVAFMKQVLGHDGEGNQTLSYDVDYVIEDGSTTHL